MSYKQFFPVFFSLLISFLLATNSLFAQNDIPVGTWRTHLTYFDAHSLTLANNRVYCASQNALFYFDKDSQETSVLSTIEGLSDTKIASLAYHETTKTLVIAYKNGNIDLLNDAQGKGNEQVTNIRSILNANQLTDKTIYHVNLDGDFAYLSTDFGVVVLDLNTQRIKETYSNIGTNGVQLKVYASTTTSQNIVLATEIGLRSASLSNAINRLDFNNWTTLVSPSAIKTVGNLGEVIYFGTDQEQFYSYSNGQKQPLGLQETDFYSITNSNGKLLVASELGLFELNSAGNLEIIFDEKIRKPQQAFYDSNNKLWIADSEGGLTTNSQGSFENTYPSGTFSSTAVDVNFFDNQTVVVSGQYDENGNSIENLSGFYAFENGNWTNYNSKNILADAIDIPNVKNLVSSTFNPIENKAYFASFGDGLLVWDKTNDTFEVLNKSNQSSFPNNQVSAVVTDFSGNLWVAFYDVGILSSILKKAPNQDNWESFRFPNAQFPVQLILDDAQNLWIRFDPNQGGKILTFNDNGDRRTLSTSPLNGELPSNEILTMVNDKSGNIWVGTAEGLRVFTNAANTINRGQFAASRVTFDGRTLFRDDKITAIDVDGGNNKWIATEEGLFQFDDNADYLLENLKAKGSTVVVTLKERQNLN